METMSAIPTSGNFAGPVHFGENKAKQMVKNVAQRGGKEVGDFFTGNHLERPKDRWA